MNLRRTLGSMLIQSSDENPELIDRAIEHICFLADVNRLYDNALGLYDLELALLVAQQSQKVFPRSQFCENELNDL